MLPGPADGHDDAARGAGERVVLGGETHAVGGLLPVRLGEPLAGLRGCLLGLGVAGGLAQDS